MSDTNLVILCGRIKQAPQFRPFPNGGGVTNVTVVTEKCWQDKKTNTERKKATFHKVDVYNTAANYIRDYADVGDTLHIVGELDEQNYTDQKGQNRHVTKVVVKTPKGEVTIVHKAKANQQQQYAPTQQQQSQQQYAPTQQQQSQQQYAPTQQQQSQQQYAPTQQQQSQQQYAPTQQQQSQQQYAPTQQQQYAPTQQQQSQQQWSDDRPFR